MLNVNNKRMWGAHAEGKYDVNMCCGFWRLDMDNAGCCHCFNSDAVGSVKSTSKVLFSSNWLSLYDFVKKKKQKIVVNDLQHVWLTGAWEIRPKFTCKLKACDD